ncbi:MAG: S24/S26 family peptidase [Clostridia bacterium]|nr:S24/S26 family peptidase [Clostridia bacterium]
MIFKRIRPPVDIIAPLIIEEIGAGNDVKIGVTGFSMYPLLRSESDMVILSKPENIKKLDVVFYKRPNGQYVLHRIIRKKGDVLSIAGDNETELEHPVYVSDCIGKMTYYIRNGKKHSVNSISYLLYCHFWKFIFPFRHIAVKAIMFIGKHRRK